jgi:hypothetical protein
MMTHALKQAEQLAALNDQIERLEAMIERRKVGLDDGEFARRVVQEMMTELGILQRAQTALLAASKSTQEPNESA